MNKTLKNVLLYVTIPLLIILMIFALWSSGLSKTDLKYSEILQKFEDNQIAKFELNMSSGDLVYVERGKTDKEAVQFTLPDSRLFLLDIEDVRREGLESKDPDR